jgi:hypothetical protein
MSIFNSGSVLDNFSSPFLSLGRSAGFYGFTATLNTGATEYFIDLIGYEAYCLIEVKVPVFKM